MEDARSNVGVSVSYWRDLESIKKWKKNIDHQKAQQQGQRLWYSRYKVRIAKVERDYEFIKL
jgi:heme-degrading monooxygenase HmoA